MAENPVEPFRVTIYDKSLRRTGLLSNPISLVVTPRDGMKGSARMVVGLDSPQLAVLMAPGARVVIDYMGKFAMSGPIIPRGLSGPAVSGTATFEVEDDYLIMHEVYAWPVPNSPITNQTARAAHVLTGPVETVAKDLIRANAKDRLGLNITVAPSLGRGPVVTVEARMESLHDLLAPKLEQAGLSLTIKQSGSSLLVDVHQPKTYPLELSEESGIVQSWSWTNRAPSATRAIIGGAGEDELRDFRVFSDAAAEAEWGRRSEVFVNASDAGSDYTQLLRDVERAAETEQRARDTDNTVQAELRQARRDAAHSSLALANAQATGNQTNISRAQSELNSDNSTVTSRAARATETSAALREATAEHNALKAQLPAAKAQYEALMAARGAETLKANAEKVGLSLALSETESFRYGETVTVGDKVTMRVGPGVTITDRLVEATLSWSHDGGVAASPTVGEMTDNPDRALAKALRTSATRIRKIEVK